MMSSDPTDDLKLRVLAGVVLLWDDEHPPVRRDFEILNEKLREAADRIDVQGLAIDGLESEKEELEAEVERLRDLIDTTDLPGGALRAAADPDAHVWQHPDLRGVADD